jgi:ribonuclease Z
VEGKLAGYSWDLLDHRRCGLMLHAYEVLPQRILRRSYIGADRFAAAGDPEALPFSGRLVGEPMFEVSAAVLQHSIPCLGFLLTERFHVNILKPGLSALGVPPGRWLTRFKNALYEGADPFSTFEIETDAGVPAGRFVLGDLQRQIARITAGQKIAYITDAGDGPWNREAIRSLAQTVDMLFIEASFLDEERERAAATHHLTARQAGQIAAFTGARQFTIFHFSPRYRGREEELVREARKAYAAAKEQAGAGRYR